MFARTKRLTLRPGWPEDAEPLAQAIGHASVIMRLSNVPWPYTVDDARAYLARPVGTTEPIFLVDAHEGGAPTLVGSIGLHVLEGAHEIGYWFTPRAWGCGYATEAGRAVVAIARHALPITRLRSRYHRDNPASGRVLGKLGFRPTGEIRSVPSLAQGRPVETVMVEYDPAGRHRPAAPIA